ncbi:MAG: hypothetical protein ACRDQB_00225, partial [Thermocrispum sp.]
MTVMEPNAPASATATDISPTTIEPEFVDTAEAARTQPDVPAGAPAEGADPSAGPALPHADDLPPGTMTADDVLSQINGAAATTEAAAAITPIPIPRPTPLPLPFRVASGRYRSSGMGFQLELRVDVDGRRPLRKLSGDYFVASGTTMTYFGSFTVDAVTVTTTPTQVTVVGTARTTWSTTFTITRVTIPRVTIFRPAPQATIRWFTSSGAAGATYVCAWQAGAFRTVELEQDCESGVTAFVSHNTGVLPSGGPARTLNVAAAYAEAGVQMLDTGGANTIGTPSGHIWTNASLHHAMQTHFSRFSDQPQFKVWLLHARAHEYGTGLRGIMFDQQGMQRQGCASFYQVISAPTDANRREQLYVNVHELGHCFNLYHSFHKSYMNPPLPNRPGSLSWMNYPQNYQPGGGAPGGAAAFWAAFPFQFDDLELAHLRHGFRNAVIMGGNPFGTGAALEVADEFLDRVSDTSGLSLSIRAADERPLLGTPVVLEISLRAERRQQVHRRDQLHPKFGFVQVAISRPRGDVVAYQPPVRHCVDAELQVSGHSDELPTSAYIGYDACVGQVFEDPGTYRIRASYAAPDGTMIVSGTATLRVSPPRTAAEDDVAQLLLGEQAGMALTLLGTDSPYLAEGTEALHVVLAEHPEHPAAVYAQLALGTNLARPFTDVDADGTTRVRERDLAQADELLGAAVEASRGEAGLD